MKHFLHIVLRYKLIHIVFWTIKALSLYHELSLRYQRPASVNWFDTLNVIGFQMLAVYVSIYYVFPRFYKKEKYVAFWGGVVLTIALAALFDSLSQLLAFSLRNGQFYAFRGRNLVTYISHFVDAAEITFVFVIIVLIEFYYRRDQQNKRLEKERLEAELHYLKAQINPHFLFNALNSVYILMKEDVKKSEETLLKFSSLLRYQLYDCSHDATTLDNEVEFIKNYISLEQLRSGENRELQLSFPVEPGYMRIAPFIISPFIENAFKHVSHYDDRPNKISVTIGTSGRSLVLEVENTFEELMPVAQQPANGIGLQNVKRRLELQYPGRHSLNINSNGPVYKVNLKLELDEN